MCFKNIKRLTKEYKLKDNMHFKMHFYMLLMSSQCRKALPDMWLCNYILGNGIFFMQFLTTTAIPCDSCGNECASACGTKHFRTCCFNYLRKRTDPNAMKMITNKRLIDFIMLQGHAMFTQDELSHERKQQKLQQQEHQLQQQEQQKLLSSRSIFPFNDERHHNGTFIVEDLQAYYD